MSKVQSKREKRIRRHKRVRAKVFGTSAAPRLSVFRSNKHIWAQLIDDVLGRTIVAASDAGVRNKKKTADKPAVMGLVVGELLAKKAQEKKINSAVFDRGGYKYHGVVKAVADGARKGGLKF